MPQGLGAAAYARARGFRYVEEQHNTDCLKHALNNLLFSTDRLADAAFDGKRGLTLEVARLLSGELGYWDLDMIKLFVPATFGPQLRVDTQYFFPHAFGPKEFVDRLNDPYIVGAVAHVRCIDLQRPDHYVAITPRDYGYDIIDSIPPSADRQLVRGRDIEVTGDAQSGFLVTKLDDRPLERNFLTSCGGESMLCYIRKEPLSPLLQAEEVLGVLRYQHGRDVRGVAFITAAPTAAAAEPSQLGSASPQSAQEEDMGRLVDDLRDSGDVPFDGTSSDGLKESGFGEPSHPSLNVDVGVGATPAVAACVPHEASHATQQTASDVPPVIATPKKLVIYGRTAASRKWVVDEDTGQPTCFRNNEKESTEPETVPVPWFRRGSATFLDKGTGEHRALTKPLR